MRLLKVTAFVASVLLLGANAYAGTSLTRVSGPSPYPLNCSESGPGTLYHNSEVQPHLAVNPRNPLHLVGTYQQDRWSSIASQGVLTATSFDGGRTWKRSVPPVSECSNGPDYKRATDSWVSVAPDGTAYLATLAMTKAFFEPDAKHAIQVSRSTNGGLAWEKPTTLVADGGPTKFNDLPAVTADPVDSRFVYVVWTSIEVFNETDFTGSAYLARSSDGGRTWERPRPIHEPGLNRQTVANKIVIRPDGTLVNVFSEYLPAATGGYELDVMAISSADRGRTWSAPVKVADLHQVGAKDPETGTPIRTGAEFVQAAVDPRGNVYVVWQDSRLTGGQRDGIVLSRSTDGRTWSQPVAVNGDKSVAAFSAALAVRRDGTVGVTYYDLRGNTSDPATLPTQYWLATSRDGVTWSEQRVTSFDLATAPKVERPVPSLYLGDYHGLVASGSAFVPFFPISTKDPDNRTEIFSVRR